MNKENILELADVIEKQSIPDLGFNMAYYFADDYNDYSGHRCDTTACIYGFAMTIMCSGDYLDARFSSAISYYDVDEWLGVDVTMGARIRYYLDAVRNSDGRPVVEITPHQAARTLRHLAETGNLDWAVGQLG